MLNNLPISLKKTKQIVATSLLALTLTAGNAQAVEIFGISIFSSKQEIKARNFSQYKEQVTEIRNDIAAEQGQMKAEEFLFNLHKIAAYRNFKPKEIKFKNGLIEIDVLSILSKDETERLRASYSVLVTDLPDGISLKSIKQTAEKLEEVSIKDFQSQVENLEAELDKKIEKIEAYLDKTENILNSVTINGDATVDVKQTEEKSLKVATINSVFLNGSQYIIDELRVVFSVLDPNEPSNILAVSPVKVSFDKRFEDDRVTFNKNNSRISVGESIKVQVDITEGSLVTLPEGVYAVSGQVSGVKTTLNEKINSIALERGLDVAQNMKKVIEDYKSSVPDMFKSSFR